MILLLSRGSWLAEMDLLDVDIGGGLTISFDNKSPAADVLDFLKLDPRAGLGTLSDKDGHAVLPSKVMTTDRGPYVFRKSAGWSAQYFANLLGL